MKTKITEIKITAGKEVFILSTSEAQVVVGGRSFYLPDKLAAKLFKAVATPAEQMCDEMRNFKS